VAPAIEGPAVVVDMELAISPSTSDQIEYATKEVG